jgi:hypothetical protein
VNPYLNDEASWQRRLKEIQREVEYSRLVAANGGPALLHLARHLVARARRLGRAATRLGPRRRRVRLEVVRDEPDAAPRVA